MPSKTFALAFMVLAALLLLAACNGNGEDGGEAPASPTGDETPAVAGSPPPELCPKVDDEVVQAVFALLELDESSYAQGEPIDVTLRLVNCASRPITRTFPDAQRYDFSAKTEGGEEVWRWSEGMAFEETQGEETYQPGEQSTVTETWDQLDNEGQAVEPGRYELTVESTGCDDSMLNCGPTAILFVDITAP